MVMVMDPHVKHHFYSCRLVTLYFSTVPQVSELKQALAASQAHASAPATPMAPSTPSAHGLGAFSEIRVSTAKRHAMAAADTAGMEELSSDVAALRAEVGDFKVHGKAVRMMHGPLQLQMASIHLKCAAGCLQHACGLTCVLRRKVVN